MVVEAIVNAVAAVVEEEIAKGSGYVTYASNPTLIVPRASVLAITDKDLGSRLLKNGSAG